MSDVYRGGGSGAPVRLCDAALGGGGVRRDAAQYGQAGLVSPFTSELEEDEEDEEDGEEDADDDDASHVHPCTTRDRCGLGARRVFYMVCWDYGYGLEKPLKKL